MARNQRKPEPRGVDEPAIRAMHPGPGADYVPPVARVETPADKLARMEREFLEAALNRALDDRYSSIAANARAIVVQRAQITG